MAFCAFSEQYSIFDITPVDNLFIEDHMLRAPGDFVKVYLYGLRLCYARDDRTDLDQVAKVLGLDQETVQNAMLFWERQGLVRRLSDHPPQYEYVNLRQRLLQAQNQSDDSVYAMGQFNNEVLRRLGVGGRVIHGDEFSRMYQWMDDYSLSETAILRVIDYLCAQNRAKGRKTAPTVNAVEKFILKMASQKIVSDEAVERYLHGLDDETIQLKQLLAHIGIRKDEPSAAEEALFAKWRGWGFDLETLKLLSNEMTRIQKPTLGYLDRIVCSYHEMGVRTPEQIRTYQTSTIEPVRQVLSALGGNVGLSTQLVELYQQYRAQGFEHDLLVEAAKVAARTSATPGNWQSVLDRYAAAGIFTMDAFTQERSRQQHLRSFAQQVLHTAGDSSSVSTKEMRQVETWITSGRSEALILYAATLCSNTPYKLSAIGRLLNQWEQAQVSTPEQARALVGKAAGTPPAQTEPKRVSKSVSAQNYHQRDYDADDYEDMVLFDLNQFKGNEHDKTPDDR